MTSKDLTLTKAKCRFTNSFRVAFIVSCAAYCSRDDFQTALAV
jgi:hypothetical protein